MALVLPSQREDRDRLIFSVPQVGTWIFGGAFALVAVGIFFFFPEAKISRMLFAVLSLWIFSGLLKAHELIFHVPSGTWVLRWGWRWQTVAKGDTSAVVGFFVDRHRPEPGLVDTPLRSRALVLELDWGEDLRAFRIGFPMGPKIAAARAEHYAERLGVPWADRSGEPDPADA